MKPYYPVIRVFGVLLVCFSLTMLVPWIYSYTIKDGAQGAYDEALLLSPDRRRPVVGGAPPET
jgi:hypothetical protein